MSYDKAEKITATFKSCKRKGIKLLQPSINNSYFDFSIEMYKDKKAIRYGLIKIKDTSKNACNYIIKLREHYGKFTSFEDFCSKTTNKDNVNKFSNKVNKVGTASNPVDKKVMNALLKAGVFDEFEPDRYKLINYYFLQIRKEKDFKVLTEEFTLKKKLSIEKELFDFYISEHPLDRMPNCEFGNLEDEEVVNFACQTISCKKAKTKYNTEYMRIVAETIDGEKLLSMFKNFSKSFDLIKKPGTVFIATASYNEERDNFKLLKIRLVKAKSTVENTDDEVVDKIKEPAMPKIMPKVIKQDIVTDYNDVTDFFKQFEG